MTQCDININIIIDSRTAAHISKLSHNDINPIIIIIHASKTALNLLPAPLKSITPIK